MFRCLVIVGKLSSFSIFTLNSNVAKAIATMTRLRFIKAGLFADKTLFFITFFLYEVTFWRLLTLKTNISVRRKFEKNLQQTSHTLTKGRSVLLFLITVLPDQPSFSKIF